MTKYTANDTGQIWCRPWTIAIALLVLLLQGCSGYSVKTDRDSGFAIADYDSFRFVDPVTAVTRSSDLVNPLVVDRVTDALAGELQALGLKQSRAGEDSDGTLLVDFVLQSEERTRYRPSTLSLGFGVRRSGLLFGGNRDVLPEDYTSGRFAVELRKPTPGEADEPGPITAGEEPTRTPSKVVWYGVANHNFLGMSADDSQDQVREVVASLLSELKPEPKD